MMAAVPDAPPSASAPVVLYDGLCGLCDRWVQWVLRRDPGGVFRFAPLQSAAAARLLGEGRASLPDSIVLLDGEGVHTESEAVLRIARRLGRLGLLRAAAVVVPKALRDGVYRLVARNRARIFGRLPACRVPTPAERSRFLSD
jgi:predicted DCC family thiol-disulfide oxidoreductase YuxK